MICKLKWNSLISSLQNISRILASKPSIKILLAEFFSFDMFWVCLFPWMKKKKCENRMTCCADSRGVMQKHHSGKISCKLYLKGCGDMQQSGFLPWASYQLQTNWQCLWIIAHLYHSSLDHFPLHSKLLVESLELGNCSGMKENWRSVAY